MANTILQRFFGSKDPKKNAGASIVASSLQRAKQDVGTWREAIAEAEQAYFPQRVKIQKLFVDTVLNGHVSACMDKRKKLTLQRDFQIIVGGKEDENLKPMFKTKWFKDLTSYLLDAPFYGYSLVSLGDVVNDNFPELTLIKRPFVSPDRMQVAPFEGMITGVQFDKDPLAKWHIYADTPSENGYSRCGYGLLYKVAMYEIICRNLIGFNADAAEVFGMPIRWGKTHKTEEAERAEFLNSLIAMGSNASLVTDLSEELVLLQNSTGATGYQIFENLEKRCEAKISKVLLGHADAIDSVPGKLGNDGEESPAQQSLKEIKTSDGEYVENIINNQIIPKLRQIGFVIPEGAVFTYSNNDEKEEYRARVDKSNKVTADIAQTMKSAGLKMDAKYFEDRTGIVTTEDAEPEPETKPIGKIENRLKELYK